MSKKQLVGSAVEHLKQDSFYWLKRPTVAGIRDLLKWAHRQAMATHITYLDISENLGRLPGNKPFEEVIKHVGVQAKPFFRVILRKDQNWYLLLTDEKHIEDLIEIGVGGIEIDSKEYFIQCFLRKELMGQLKRKFRLGSNSNSGDTLLISN